MTVFIYLITNLQNNKKYVGFTTKTIEWRFRAHLNEAIGGSSRLLCKAIRKYGIDNFSIQTLEEVGDLEEAKLKEIFYISEFKTFGAGYNMTIGGDYTWQGQNQEFREYHRKRVKEGMANRSEEKQKATSKKKSEYWASLTEDQKEKRHLSRIEGNKAFWASKSKEDRSILHHRSNVRRFKIIDPQSNEYTIENMAKFCRENNLSNSAMSAVANGKLPHHKKWKCIKV